MQLAIASPDGEGDISVIAVDNNLVSVDCPNIVMFYNNGGTLDFYIPDSVNRLVCSKFGLRRMECGSMAPSFQYLNERIEISSSDIYERLMADRVGDSVVFTYHGVILFALGPTGLTLNCGVIIDSEFIDCYWNGLEDINYYWKPGEGLTAI